MYIYLQQPIFCLLSSFQKELACKPFQVCLFYNSGVIGPLIRVSQMTYYFTLRIGKSETNGQTQHYHFQHCDRYHRPKNSLTVLHPVYLIHTKVQCLLYIVIFLIPVIQAYSGTGSMESIQIHFPSRPKYMAPVSKKSRPPHPTTKLFKG